MVSGERFDWKGAYRKSTDETCQKHGELKPCPHCDYSMNPNYFTRLVVTATYQSTACEKGGTRGRWIMELECGHTDRRKGSRRMPKTALCRECERRA